MGLNGPCCHPAKRLSPAAVKWSNSNNLLGFAKSFWKILSPCFVLGIFPPRLALNVNLIETHSWLLLPPLTLRRTLLHCVGFFSLWRHLQCIVKASFGTFSFLLVSCLNLFLPAVFFFFFFFFICLSPKPQTCL